MTKFFRNISITLTIVIGIVGYGNAQNSGYLGKRMFIQYALPMNVAVAGEHVSGKRLGVEFGTGDGGFRINFKNELSVHYALSRNTSMYLKYGYVQLGDNITYHTIKFYPDSTGYNDAQLMEDYTIFYVDRVNEITLGLDFYNLAKGALAPIGPYYGIWLSRLIVNSERTELKSYYAEYQDPYGYTYDYSDGNLSQIKKFNDSRYSDYVFGLSFGTRSIIRDRVVLTFQQSFGLAFGGLYHLVDSEAQYQSYGSDNTDAKYSQGTGIRMLKYYSYNFSVGVGVLLF